MGAPVALARRFSPSTNGGLKPNETALRVLVATDVLSEGQNLQDSHVTVNYDLPWAIIRLIQRAGRVDRIDPRACRTHVRDRFSLAAMARNYAALYHQVLDGRRTAPRAARPSAAALAGPGLQERMAT